LVTDHVGGGSLYWDNWFQQQPAGAVIATVVMGAYVAFGLVIDPAVTPLRVTGFVLLATVLGLA